jgi:prepilin peptidase CpaA
MMETTALAVATAAMAVLMGITAWYDLKYLRIPNWCVLAALGIFLVTGPWGLPLDVFGWRLLHAVIVLVLGFGLYTVSSGHVGGGDIKMIAALTPFVPGSAVGFVLILFALLSFVGLVALRFAKAMVGERKTGWAALDQRRFFPVGLLLGGTIMIYLVVELAGRFAA